MCLYEYDEEKQRIIEEKEREEFTRLKVIKRMKQKKSGG